MNVLVYGGGAREHAIAWKVSQSMLLTKLYLAEPNDGFRHLGEVIEFDNFIDLAKSAKEKGIELLIVGPELPLSQGIVDVFETYGIKSIGVNQKWSRLESSKSFAKDFMNRNAIPTAGYKIIDDKSQIHAALSDIKYPIVIKADGLAAGKGVVIAQDRIEAISTLNDFLGGKYSDASKKIVLEEFLVGEELSLIALWDGETLLPFISARDYKRLLNNNEGPNTGGMGSYCPVDLTIFEQEGLSGYIKLLKEALLKEKADFVGVIYSGLMLTGSGVMVLEYNMRFGDPETQALLIHLDSDLLEVFVKAVSKKLSEVDLSWKNGISACLVVAAEGYPENPVKGAIIDNIDSIQNAYAANVFYAGVKNKDNNLVANGGRVLSICRNADNPYPFVYAAADELNFKDKIYRNDIGS